eukprot:6189035-Pleurochrysis_carterae.AAC.1
MQRFRYSCIRARSADQPEACLPPQSLLERRRSLAGAVLMPKLRVRYTCMRAVRTQPARFLKDISNSTGLAESQFSPIAQLGSARSNWSSADSNLNT